MDTVGIDKYELEQIISLIKNLKPKQKMLALHTLDEAGWDMKDRGKMATFTGKPEEPGVIVK